MLIRMRSPAPMVYGPRRPGVCNRCRRSLNAHAPECLPEPGIGAEPPPCKRCGYLICACQPVAPALPPPPWIGSVTMPPPPAGGEWSDLGSAARKIIAATPAIVPLDQMLDTDEAEAAADAAADRKFEAAHRADAEAAKPSPYAPHVPAEFLPIESGSLVPSGATIRMTARPQMPFEIAHLEIPRAIASCFSIEELRVGNTRVFPVSFGGVPGELFTHDPPILLPRHRVEIQRDVMIEAVNVSAGALAFRGCVYGPRLDDRYLWRVWNALRVYLSRPGANFGYSGRPSDPVADAQRENGGIGIDGIVGYETRRAAAAAGVTLPMC